VPRAEEQATQQAPFSYAVIRIVPRVERAEFVNAGIVLFSRPHRYLGIRIGLDEARLRALWPDIDLGAIRRQLDVLCRVAAGDPAGGALAMLPPAERFGWLSSPASTVVQPGPVHAGLATDPEAALNDLFAELVMLPSRS
jgi:hypothetical protein